LTFFCPKQKPGNKFTSTFARSKSKGKLKAREEKCIKKFIPLAFAAGKIFLLPAAKARVAGSKTAGAKVIN
jgi:hypothetical protein